MSVVHFVSSQGISLARVEASEGDLLLDLARLNDVPLHWRCGQGTCGTCRVHIQHDAQPQSLHLCQKERNVLLRAGLLSAEDAARDTLIDQSDTWRLACHVRLTDADCTVVVPERD